ncbi:hypothetical protein BN159_6059 [Streptomyces davaonensis JCM 4913]|uniref:Carrier domain-containing protein n=1 Tax=Streptomyces davaonensis (strain DSM 101723 / JCM 4913 / KCC S-0913 / 768) TaxID=1214101 RepID=K4RAL9_STRDJ|nr:acyl carrier protein [Streptomyces davaonensis]CCK30438.1 hypothetical protein BN159_6059 [Streptomyces davaonensis JCM 4913]
MPAEPHTAPAPPLTIPEDDIAAFVVERFLPGVDRRELEADYDLLASAVIDSLGVLHIAAWLEERYGLRLPDEELTSRNFRSVHAIQLTAARATTGGRG